MKSISFYALLARLLLGFIFFSSGFCKLTDGNFGQLIGPPHLIDQLSQYGLRGFGFLIAFCQVFSAALILTQRFSLSGLVMLVPMNLSILGVTISMEWDGTPLVNSFLLLVNVICLLYEKDFVRLFFANKKQEFLPRAAYEFPAVRVPLIIMTLVAAGILFSNQGGLLLNITASVIIVLTVVNILGQQKFSRLEQSIILCFGAFCLSIIFANSLAEKTFYFLIISGGLGFVLVLVRAFVPARLYKNL